MAKKIRITTAENEAHSDSIKEFVHGVNEIYDDFTICTISYGCEEYKTVNTKISCPDCIPYYKIL